MHYATGLAVVECRQKGSLETCSVMGNRFADSAGGLKLKITEAAIPNQNGTYLTSKQGNYTLTDLGNSTLTLPSSATSSWAKFNTTYLGGNSTYPLISVGYAAVNQDVRLRGGLAVTFGGLDTLVSNHMCIMQHPDKAAM